MMFCLWTCEGTFAILSQLTTVRGQTLTMDINGISENWGTGSVIVSNLKGCLCNFPYDILNIIHHVCTKREDNNIFF